MDGCRWCAPEISRESAVVSTKGDVYSLGMTIPEVGSCLFLLLLSGAKCLRVAYAPGAIRQHQENLAVVAKNWESG